MTTRLSTAALLTLALATGATGLQAQQQAKVENPQPKIEDLGNQQYRIGAIEVDKAAGQFSVSASVLRDEPPIEFLIATKGGHKSYESVLEAHANAFEFNLACILIGLDAENATSKQRPVGGGFDLDGDLVEVTVSWTANGKEISTPGARLLMHGNPPQPLAADDWIYMGGTMMDGGYYLPDVTGTLLGVVHRGESVIEHRSGVGVGNYGSVLVNTELIPEVGAVVKLTIANPASRPDSGAAGAQ